MSFVPLSGDLSCPAFTFGGILVPDLLDVTGYGRYRLPQPKSMVSAPPTPTESAVTDAGAPRETGTPP